MTATGDDRYEIRWLLSFAADRDNWFDDRRMTDPVVDLVTEIPWWGDLTYHGRKPMPSLTRWKAQLAAGTSRFGFSDERYPKGQCDVRVEFTHYGLHVVAGVRGAVLQRVGRAAIGACVRFVVGVERAWGTAGHIDEGHVWPVAQPSFAYPHVKPRRTSYWGLGHVLDIANPTPNPRLEPDNQGLLSDRIAIAKAKPPAGVKRMVRGNTVYLRWVDDPRERAKVRSAAARHEAWALKIVENEPRRRG